jgi:hypothetical protein
VQVALSEIQSREPGELLQKARAEPAVEAELVPAGAECIGICAQAELDGRGVGELLEDEEDQEEDQDHRCGEPDDPTQDVGAQAAGAPHANQIIRSGSRKP